MSLSAASHLKKSLKRLIGNTGVRGGGLSPPWLENFQGKLCLQSKRKLLKNPE